MATEKSNQILEELTELSVAIINYCKEIDLPRSVQDQLIRSVTSMGANFAEAQDASSKKDFVNKIYIAKKESFETKYWLMLVKKLTNDNEVDALTQQTQRFLMMFQKIINTSKEGNRK